MRMQQRTFFRDNPNAPAAEIMAAGYRGFSRYTPPKTERQYMAYFPVNFSNVMWSDFETTHFDVDAGHPLEVCIVKTDDVLNVVDKIIVTIAFDLDIWDKPVHPKVRLMHSHSGLWDRCRRSDVMTEDADEALSRFVQKHWCGNQKARVGGCNPAFDRAWFAAWLPLTNSQLDYHNFEIRTLQDTMHALGLDVDEPVQEDRHTAVGDVMYGIEIVRRVVKRITGATGMELWAAADEPPVGNAIDT